MDPTPAPSPDVTPAQPDTLPPAAPPADPAHAVAPSPTDTHPQPSEPPETHHDAPPPPDTPANTTPPTPPNDNATPAPTAEDILETARCTICKHPKRAQIEEAIRKPGIARETIAERWAVTRHAIRWHTGAHMARREVSPLDRLRSYELTLRRLSVPARGKKVPPTIAMAAIREASSIAETIAKMEQHTPPPSDPFTQHPAWLATLAAITEALSPYPEARRAVVDAIARATQAEPPAPGVSPPSPLASQG